MDLKDLPEEQFNEVKNQLIEKEMLFERKKINSFDIKFFETVTISNSLIKFFLFFSMGIYILLNLIGIILSYIHGTLGNPIGNIVGLCAICFIVFAIFNNINTNKKKEENLLFIKDNHFIFNFRDEGVETPKLFYSLPYDSIKKIEFIIYKLKKGQLFGSVTFIFTVFGYEVYHIIRFTNLTEIETNIKDKFPALKAHISIDEKGKEHPSKNKQKLKNNLLSLAIFITSLLLIVIPYALKYYSMSLTFCAILLLITAIFILLSSFLYTYHLVQGILVSCIFIIIGFLLPSFIIEMSDLSILAYISINNEILLTTVFGIIGLCLYAYSIIILIGKITYKIKKIHQ